MIVIPETTIHQSLEKGLNYIKLNYQANIATPQKSWLYKVLQTEQFQRYNFFENAKTVFLAKKDNPRKIECNLFFNLERAHIPTIHVTLPGLTPINNAIGIGSGFRETDFDIENGEQFEVFNKRQRSTYNIILTSDNTMEVILMFNVVYALLIALTDHFNLSGIENIQLGGGDIQMDPSIVPTHVFMRAITFSCEFDFGAPALFSTNTINFINEMEDDSSSDSSVVPIYPVGKPIN